MSYWKELNIQYPTRNIQPNKEKNNEQGKEL